MRLVIELAEEADGRWRASIPDMPDLTVYGLDRQNACHLAIGEALSRIDDLSDVSFVSGDQEWQFSDQPRPKKREFLRPTSIAEVVEAVQCWPQLRIVGGDTSAIWSPYAGEGGKRREAPLPQLELRRLNGVVQHDVADQVVVVRAGTSLDDLKAALSEHGQCLPLGARPGLLNAGTVGGAISLNLPHTLEGQTGSWRDWILGLTVVTASGEVVKCGSKAVKNVAGYDVQRLFIGARGTLGVIVEATLRTYPLKALPEPRLVSKGELKPFQLIVHRVLPTDFPAAFDQYEAAVGEPGTGTTWANLSPDREPRRFEGDWVLRAMCGERNLPIDDPTQIHFMRRAKELFDPASKLNPGEMGIF